MTSVRKYVRADEIRVGDWCVSRVGSRERLYPVTRISPGPYGVVTVNFVGEHRWVLPVQEMKEVERHNNIHVTLRCSECKRSVYMCKCGDPIWEQVESGMKVVYIVIGNSDNKLRQDEWSAFATNIDVLVQEHAHQVFGVWASNPLSPYQNASWSFQIEDTKVDGMKALLDVVRKQFRQDSLIWSEAVPQFIGEDT